MTKETKIGLVVGLAFIILFAIILSEKGANTGSKVPSDLTVADSNEASTTGAEYPLQNDGRVAVESLPSQSDSDSSTPTSIVMLEEPVGQPIPGEDEPIEQLPPSVLERLNVPLIESEIPVDTSEQTAEADSMSLDDAVKVALNEGSLVVDDDAPIEPQSSTRASFLDRPDSSPRKPKKSLKIIAVHEVRNGESLGKIAAKHYGRSTPARIAAIYDANRDKLTSIHSVRAGTSLDIPKLASDQDIVFESALNFAPAEVASLTRPPRDTAVRIPVPVDERRTSRRRPSRTSLVTADGIAPSRDAAPNFKWYKVRDRDTLSRIAKRELGNEKLYLEIYKLNKDIIRDRHMIKPGMKIRLPIQVSSRLPMGMVLTALEADPTEP